MTDEKQDYSSFERYMYGALAGRFLQSKENARHTPSALEVLAGAKGLNLGEEAEGFIKGTQASEKGIQTAVGIYAGKFEEKRGEYSPSQLSQFYLPILDGLENGTRETILRHIKEYTEPLKEIIKKYKRAAKIVEESEDDDFKDMYTPEQVSEAKKTAEKYGKVLNTLQKLDEYKFETLRPDAVDVTRKSELKNLASKL